MKKLKILPSVLMLVLCVGVLCMGIYAASPNSNQITGSITINAANPEVSYKAYLGNNFNENTLIGQTSGRQNNQLVLDSENLVLDMSSAATKEDVAPIEIWLELTNKSTSESLGAYFAEGAVNRTAVFDDILMTQPIYEDPEAQEKNTVANINLPFYHQLPKATVEGGETTYYPVYMRLTITPETMVESRLENLEFTLNLNIESYVASENTNDELYKIAEGATLEPESGYDFMSCKGVVFPQEFGVFDYLWGEEKPEGMDVTYITIAPGMSSYFYDVGYYTNCQEIVLPLTVKGVYGNFEIPTYVPLELYEMEADSFDNWFFYGPGEGVSFENGVLTITSPDQFENPLIGYAETLVIDVDGLTLQNGVMRITSTEYLENSFIERAENGLYVNVDGMVLENGELTITSEEYLESSFIERASEVTVNTSSINLDKNVLTFKSTEIILQQNSALALAVKKVDFADTFDFANVSWQFVASLENYTNASHTVGGAKYLRGVSTDCYCIYGYIANGLNSWSIHSETEIVMLGGVEEVSDLVIPSSVKYVYGGGFQYAYLLQTITFKGGENLLAPFVFPTQICPEDRMPVNVKWYTDSNKTVSAGDSITARPADQTYYFKQA